MRFFVLHPLAILVAMVINCLLSSVPIMYAIILLLGVLLAPGIDSRPMLIFPLSLGSRLFVLICLMFCYIVLIRVDVSVPSGAFLFLAGILLFLFVLLVLSMSVLK